MKIEQYITDRQMRRLAVESLVRPGFVPRDLHGKFTADETVEYYATADQSRWAGVSSARNFFAAWKAAGEIAQLICGRIDEDHPTLSSF